MRSWSASCCVSCSFLTLDPFQHKMATMDNLPLSSMIFPFHILIYIYIRRPLPSLGVGGAAPGITAGVQHQPRPSSWLCLSPHALSPVHVCHETIPRSARREAPLCSPLPAPCQVEIVQLEGFKICAKHVPPGPETLPCNFSPPCQRFAIALSPCLARSKYCI